MYFQFLIEDESTGVLVEHIMEKISEFYPENLLEWNIRAFKGIGHLNKKGTPLEQKTGKLLNDLPLFLRAFDRSLRSMGDVALVVVLDNDKRDKVEFRKQLEEIARQNMILIDHAFCIAVKEMEAWLLGDIPAIEQAYPDMKRNAVKLYEQDGICDTWEVLANMVYPGGLGKLKKNAAGSYTEIGKAKYEWADKIGRFMDIYNNASPSFQKFIGELAERVKRG